MLFAVSGHFVNNDTHTHTEKQNKRRKWLVKDNDHKLTTNEVCFSSSLLSKTFKYRWLTLSAMYHSQFNNNLVSISLVTFFDFSIIFSAKTHSRR